MEREGRAGKEMGEECKEKKGREGKGIKGYYETGKKNIYKNDENNNIYKFFF